MSRSSWWSEARAVWAKDWRVELRARYALSTVALFSFSTLVVVSLALGPLGVSSSERHGTLPVILWILVLFAATAGVPRTFLGEEEAHTAAALRLWARPSALYAGKLAFAATLLFALEILVAPLFVGISRLEVASPAILVAALTAGGYGLAAGSTLVAAIVSQARGRSSLFPVVAFPILIPVVLLGVELTRTAVSGAGSGGELLAQLLLLDATLTVAGFMLFPALWET